MVLEDNDAVIHMIMKGRTNRMRHVPRTHRIDLDWLFDLMREDSSLKLKYKNTKSQVADIFTKGLWRFKSRVKQFRICAFSRDYGA